METLSDFVDSVEARRKTLEVHTDDAAVATALESQFSTRNVDVTRRQFSDREGDDFVVVRDAEGTFLGALGTDQLEQILSPETHPPQVLADSEVDLGEILDVLDRTVFTSFERRQLVAIVREFEERAWRVGTGTVYVGFQRAEALAAQTPLYNRLARETDLSITVFLDDAADPDRDTADLDLDDSIGVVSPESAEIGQYWFFVFDGGADGELYKCALLAAERTPGSYHGFWTDGPGLVDDLYTYLRTRYVA
ncbi:DICT sensory domain-containing protein [Halosimplex salinum]|uniref:DICT sensory domain-containing protein n=1 Tax=Halosimplex salinum TaxID=1710538 RepID=UPI000F49ABE2|nr:DICT sensory domain-containing protein [Halosimplex salinum]